MSEIIAWGKSISIAILGLIYIKIWLWASDHAIDCNSNSKAEVVVSRAWILIHIIAAVIFFIYCWTR